jgi:hypothetical protein
MNKLKLRLDDLRIDSFDTTAPQKAKGTVFGEQCTCYTQCTCPGCPTCDASCNGTCGYTCQGTCNEATCAEGYTCLYWGTCDNTGCNYSCNGCGGTMNTAQGPRGECAWCP